jgi:hypothetical protein
VVEGPLHFVLLQTDLRKYLVLPDKEIDLGVFVSPDESLVLERIATARGPELLAKKVS